MEEFQDENGDPDFLEQFLESFEKSLNENVEKISGLLEGINNIQQVIGLKNLNIQFPKGVIKTADYFRGLLSFIDDKTLKTNIAYNLMLTDFYKWVLNTFGIDRTIKEMVIKELICTYGHILESISKYLCEKFELADIYDEGEIEKVKDYVKKSVNDEKLKSAISSYLGNLPSREIGVESALNKLVKEDIIKDDLKNQLIENIWKIRCREHLTTLKEKEYKKYTSTLGQNAIRLFNELLDTLKNNNIG